MTSGRAAGLAAGMLLDRDPETLTRAAAEIAASRDIRALPFLLEAVRGNPDAAYALRQALAGVGEPAVEPLLRLLTDSEQRLRDFAADTLGDIGDPRATRPLADVAASSAVDLPLRRGAVIALSKLRAAEAQEAVCRIALSGDPGLRDLAVKQLAERRSPRAVEILAETLRTADPALRAVATYHAARLFCGGEEPALAVVLSALEDAEEDVRHRVLEGIDAAAAGSIPVLTRALRDASFSIRGDALAALRGLGWSPSTSEERLLVGLSSQQGLDRTQPPDASPDLLDLAEGLARRGDAGSRARVADALAWIGGDRAIDALVRLLGDEDTAVQVASVFALARTRAPRALAEVARRVSAATGAEVFDAAAHSLGATGDARWARGLAEAYADIDPNPGDPRKWAAAEGLLGCGDPRPATWLLAVTVDEEWGAEAVRLLELAVGRAGDRLDEDLLESLATLSGVRQRTRIPGTWDEEDRERAGLPEWTEVPCDELRRLAREAQSRRRDR